MSKSNGVGPGSLVCVTGANGYLGSYVVAELLRRGYRVRGTVRDPSSDAKTAHLRALAEAGDATDRLELVRGDLMEPGSFDAAVDGCDGVLHTAAAVFFSAKDPQRELVDPSVEGTLNVLRSCAQTSSVRRVVHTSSIAAVYSLSSPNGKVFTEADWNDADTSTLKVDPYALAKVSAERAAVEFVAGLPADRDLDLVHLNPGMIWGPPMTKQHVKASPRLLRDVVSSVNPGLPRLAMAVVDVRDVAVAHAEALARPAASGRYILTADNLWYPEIASRLAAQFPDVKIVTRQIPKLLVLLAAAFDKSLNVRQLNKLVGLDWRFDGARAVSELDLSYRPVDDTLRDTAQVLIDEGWARTKKR